MFEASDSDLNKVSWLPSLELLEEHRCWDETVFASLTAVGMPVGEGYVPCQNVTLEFRAWLH